MRCVYLVAGFLVVGTPLGADDQKPVLPIGGMERKDPRFDKLIPRDARIELLADGFKWTEGPVWLPDGKHLLFSDVPNNIIWKWQVGKGATSFLKPSGHRGDTARKGEPGSNGLALDPEGLLVVCQHGDRRICRIEKDGKQTTLADRFDGKRFHSPNDLAFRGNGDLYFTDPPYGLEKGWDDPGRELDFCGVYRLARDGKLTLLTRELSRPNGIAFSPDEKKLYIADSDVTRPVWMVYDLKDDGTLGPGKVFARAREHLTLKRLGVPDGLKVDKDGNLFAAGPGGILLFAPDGTHLGTLLTGSLTSNCAWGDDDSTLYITAGQRLLRIRTTTKGAR